MQFQITLGLRDEGGGAGRGGAREGNGKPRALYGNTKSPVSCRADKLYEFPNVKDFFDKVQFLWSYGNVAPVHLRMPRAGFLRFLNFCFRHQTFMRIRMIRRGKKNLPRNYPGTPRRSPGRKSGRRNAETEGGRVGGGGEGGEPEEEWEG